MTETVRSSKMYWLLFLISAILMCLMLLYMSSWFWVCLPFVGTFLVLALDKI